MAPAEDTASKASKSKHHIHRPHRPKRMPRHNYAIKLDRKTLKTDALATLAEMMGTFLFLLIGLGGIQAAATSNQASLAQATQSSSAGGTGGSASINTVASIQQLSYIALAMGMSLLVSAWAFFRVSGSAFNPSVTFALGLCGVLSPVRVVMYACGELIAAIAASAVLEALVPGSIAVTPGLGGGTTPAQGVWIEAFITAALCFVVLMLAVEKSRATPLAPVGIGLTLFACHLWAVVYTGAGMNPARALGPSVITGFSTDHWVYWVGPTIGAIMASAVYSLLKWARYWKLNAGQDEILPEKSPAGPVMAIIEARTETPENVEKTDTALMDANPEGTTERPATMRRESASTMV